MTDTERQQLWVKLQSELADAEEQYAFALATRASSADQNRAALRVAEVRVAINSLKEAGSIRALLAKIEAIGDVGTGERI